MYFNSVLRKFEDLLQNKQKLLKTCKKIENSVMLNCGVKLNPMFCL